jgi:hypothetical protein|tara:strand:- start:196 stop:375 length:180 start_codon:yes stop_codon:yes gene_type:complete
VIRVNINSENGKEIKNYFKITLVPSFLIINETGEEIFRQEGTLPNSDLILLKMRTQNKD